MDKALEKLARQLLAYDEASLSSLWEKYAERVQHFEPTKRWEEAAVAFGMIQAVRWKNQLFNYHVKEQAVPFDGVPEGTSRPPMGEKRPGGAESENGGGAKGGKLLRFRPREDDESV